MAKGFDAAYYDGQTARRHEVRVAVGARGLRLRHADGREVVWPYAALRLAEEGFAGDPLRLERPTADGLHEAIVVADHGLLEAIARANPEAAKAFKKPDQIPAFLAKTAVAGVGTLAFGAAMFVWGVPALGNAVAAAVPPAWEADLGASVVEEIVPASERCTDKARVAAIQAIVDQLVAAKPGTPYRYKVTLSRDEMVNAFAAPGGYIVVNQGLLARTKRPEELAGVLAHEIQHVEQRHATKAICREFTMGALIKAAAGGSGDLAAAAGAAKTLGGLSYSRQAEEEADLQGMKLMRAAKLDPQGMVAAFKMLAEDGADLPSGLSYLSTHPQTGARVQAMAREAAKVRYRPVKAAEPLPWKQVVAGCR